MSRKNEAEKYNPMAENPLKLLENKVDQLIGLCNELKQENRQLKLDSESWQRERQSLLNNSELASNKVEAMIDRLRTME